MEGHVVRQGRVAVAFVCVVACHHAQHVERARQSLTAEQWTAKCRDRLEIARLALVPLDPAFADARFDIDPKPWDPIVHFEARTGEAGIWWSNVEHGRHPCAAPVAPGFTNWRDNHHDIPMQVDRYMRRDGDEAWLQAANVSDASAIAFRREMERALAACVEDARGVALVAPPHINCEGDGDGDDELPLDE